MRMSQTTLIDRPVSDVYWFVVDSNNDPQWCRNVLTSKLVSGTAGTAGARYRQVQRPGPVGRNLDVQLLRTDVPRRVELRWHTSVATFDVTYDLSDTDGPSRLIHTSDVSLRKAGHLSRPLVRLVLPVTMKQQLNDLKNVLERDTSTTPE